MQQFICHYTKLHAGGYVDEAVVLIAYEQWNVTLHSFEEGNEHVITVLQTYIHLHISITHVRTYIRTYETMCGCVYS